MLSDKLRNVASLIKILLGGDRFEWIMDMRKASRPVLLIHGFAMPRHCMGILESRLAADGFDVFGFRLGPANFLGVEKAARIIGMKLRHLRRRQGMDKIAIVGHSLGGVIGRAYVSLRGGDQLCHTLITLGSPHRGRPAGKLSKYLSWLTPAPRDLAPGSDVLKRLEENPIPPQVYCASIYSEGDRICPAPICSLDIPPGTHHLINIPVEDVSHVDFMVDAKIYEIIRTHLEEGFSRALV